MLNVRIVKWLWTARVIFSGNSEAAALNVFSVDITNLQEYKTGLMWTHVCRSMVWNGQPENRLRQYRVPATLEQTVLGKSGVHRQKNETGQHLTLHMEHNSKWTRAKNKDWNHKATSNTHMHACTYIYTQTCTYTCTQRHTHTHTCTHTHIHIHAHRHSPMHTHMCMHIRNEARLSDVAASLYLL